jgi:hypothetical protein
VRTHEREVGGWGRRVKYWRGRGRGRGRGHETRKEVGGKAVAGLAKRMVVLLRFELRLQDSESCVLTNYTIEPLGCSAALRKANSLGSWVAGKRERNEKKNGGPTEIRTQATRFRVLCANQLHYRTLQLVELFLAEGSHTACTCMLTFHNTSLLKAKLFAECAAMSL